MADAPVAVRRPWVQRSWKRLAAVAGVLGALVFFAWSCMISMPGSSFRGPLPPLSSARESLRDSLRRDVEVLAGQRNVTCEVSGLTAAARYLEQEFVKAGAAVKRIGYPAGGRTCDNLEVTVTGGEEIVVVGGHYDAVTGSPGANDNATGAAAVLALARAFAGTKPSRTLRFVGFVNEEPPHLQTPEMGSRVYAKRCRERGDKIVAMVSLETMGC